MNANLKMHLAALLAASVTTVAITGSVLGAFNAVATDESRATSVEFVANEVSTKVVVTAKRV